MLNLAGNLGARLELDKSAINRGNFFEVNFKPIFIPPFVINELHREHHRVRIACTNRMEGNNLH